MLFICCIQHIQPVSHGTGNRCRHPAGCRVRPHTSRVPRSPTPAACAYPRTDRWPKALTLTCSTECNHGTRRSTQAGTPLALVLRAKLSGPLRNIQRKTILLIGLRFGPNDSLQLHRHSAGTWVQMKTLTQRFGDKIVQQQSQNRLYRRPFHSHKLSFPSACTRFRILLRYQSRPILWAREVLEAHEAPGGPWNHLYHPSKSSSRGVWSARDQLLSLPLSSQPHWEGLPRLTQLRTRLLGSRFEPYPKHICNRFRTTALQYI